jgi:hypothetical protein
LVQLVLREQLVHLVRKDRSETLVQLVRKVQQELRGSLVQLVRKVERVYLAQPVRKAQPVQSEYKEALVQQDYKALQVLMACKEFREYKAYLELPEHLD